jgi:hypothetical protein
VEQAIGKICRRNDIDWPPYAQVLLQGDHGAAIRHPEYHLATDIALLYNLFLDAQAIIDEAQRQGRVHSSEYCQSLGRSVILACFNLLESFVSGIATAFLLENANAPQAVVNKLQDNWPSLQKRFFQFPFLVTSGRVNLVDDTRGSLHLLFGECKERRDSFVHCEPGSTPTKRGYVKEKHFHDVSLAIVRQTVDLTCEAICISWKAIHGREKPSWLPNRDPGGRFLRVTVVLRPL